MNERQRVNSEHIIAAPPYPFALLNGGVAMSERQRVNSEHIIAAPPYSLLFSTVVSR
jgi:hypothetical protein